MPRPEERPTPRAAYKRLTADKLNREGCLRLVQEIVRGASEDYIHAVNAVKDYSTAKNRAAYWARRRFFLSKYFHRLTQMDGEVVLDLLDAQCGGSIEDMVIEHDRAAKEREEEEKHIEQQERERLEAIRRGKVMTAEQARLARYSHSRQVLQKMPKNASAAAKLTALRGEMTRREVAQQLGVYDSTLRKHELGYWDKPRPEMQKRIAHYYGVRAEEIWGK